MTESKSSSGGSDGGLRFCSLLAILFIGLKLTHYIDWSWWWVLSPLWIPAVVVLVIVLVCLLFAGIAAALSKH